MDSSPRSSLQGPRPSPLKVNKDSHKISKKPPLNNIPNNYNPPPQPQPQPQPLIIYSVSPKIIHTNPSDFMSLVQQLTGPDHPVLSPAIQNPDKKSSSPSSPTKNIIIYTSGAASTVDDVEDITVDRTVSAGILSPVPSSLQPISSNFFSPITAFDIPGSMSFLSDILNSPGMGSGSGGGGVTGGFSMSPSSFLLTPSPGSSCWDLFGQFHDQ